MEQIRKLLDDYYQAINKKDIPKIKTYLSSNVNVTFKESDRNWLGSHRVDEKFGLMWSRFPNFQVEEYTLSHVTETSNGYVVEVEATFADREAKYVARKSMKYLINNGLIDQINHLD